MSPDNSHFNIGYIPFTKTSGCGRRNTSDFASPHTTVCGSKLLRPNAQRITPVHPSSRRKQHYRPKMCVLISLMLYLW